ncbi:hypothetical protein [Thermococcus sibiricus]|uniref:Uncharacterized protein n=1 Tax=Thermococcus sibiricus TaxID=172049 RepID=A0A101EKH8_9EURY|nr:hypothetical protein [Thermococcus sibiricus]KUK17026.1 MAG: hypothetical protein XD54_1668 [Thermococcus sibiricus]
MEMYDQVAQERLKEKIGYELWLFDFLSETETFEGGSNITTIVLVNRQPSAYVADTLAEALGSETVMKVLDTLMPLTFTASYKILDMIFEWILEENKKVGNIRKVPWKFRKKIKVISNSQLEYPPLFQSNQYIREYLFALYSNLLEFRNEIVHRNNFSVSDNKLQIKTNENSLEIAREELGALVRTVVAVAKMFAGILPFGKREDCLLKYHLDRIGELHGLNEFKQTKPLLIDVILKVPEEKGIFPADLKFVREQISRIYPNVDVLYNLKIIGLVGDKPSACWIFPVNFVPTGDILELRPNTYRKYLKPLDECQK